MGRNNQRALTNQSFNPAAIGSLYLWLDGTDSSTITLTSGAVSEWRDKSDNGRHVTQATASQRPVMGFLNGRSAVQFTSASSQFLTGTGAFLTGDPSFTVFVVWQKLVAQNVSPFGWGSQNTGALFWLFPSQLGGSASGWNFGGTTTYNFVLNNSDPDSFHPLNRTWFDCFVKPAGPVTGAAAYRSGQYFPPASAATAAPNIANGPFVVGNNPGTSSYLDGVVGEILVYNKALTGNERQQVEQYISQKWRITLANYKLATSPAAPAISSPLDIANCSLWLDGNDTSTLYTTDAGPVTAVTAPTDISGCVGWWDASDASSITQSGGLVSQWRDKSGNGRHANASGTARPTYAGTQNGRNVVTFDGTANRMGTSLSDAATQTIFMVSKASPAGAPGSRRGVSYGSDRSFYASSNWNWWSPNASTGQVPTEYGVVSAVIASNASIRVFGGGVLGSPEFNPTDAGSGTLTIGGEFEWATFNLFMGEIAEVIVFNSALSSINRARVEKYLALKWGINRVHETPGAGDRVGYWGDKSGSGRHFSTTTHLSRPALAETGRAGVVFNASPLLNTAPNLTVTAQTTVVVTSLDNTVNNQRIFSQTPGGLDFSATNHYIPLMRNAATAAISSQLDSANRASVSVANSIGVVMASVHTGTSVVNYVNGVRSSAYTPTAALNLALTTMSLMGDTFGGAANTSGRVSAVLVYNRALTAAEIAALTAHLSATYGLGVLPPTSGHPEVQNWINRVYANGGSVSQYTADQVTAFAREIDAAGLRSLLYRVNLFCGNDINAAYVPLYRGPVALGTRFGNEIDVTTGSGVAFTYFENVGLQGDPVSNGGVSRRHLNTGVILGAVPQLVGNHHISAYTNSLPSRGDATVGTPIGVYESASRGMTLYMTQEFYNIGAFANSQLTYANATGSKAFPTNRGHYIANHVSPILNIYEAGNKIGERDLTATFAITTPTVQPVCVFAEGRPSPSVPLFNYTNPMQGYSIGTGLTGSQALAFSQIMERFQRRLGRGVLPAYDANFFASITNTDAAAWVQAVYNAGGSVSLSTAQAVNTFCNAIDAAGIRDRFYRLNLFCGENLQACLVPLYRGPSLAGTQYGNATDFNIGFAAGDYTETTGLTAARLATNYLNTGLATADMPTSVQNSIHMAARHGVTGNADTDPRLIGASNGATDRYEIRLSVRTGSAQSDVGVAGRTTTVSSTVTAQGAKPAAFLLTTRTGDTNLAFYRNGIADGTQTTSTTSIAGVTYPFCVFRSNLTGVITGDQPGMALSCYSIGDDMSAGQVTAYYNAMQAFQTALNRNI